MIGSALERAIDEHLHQPCPATASGVEALLTSSAVSADVALAVKALCGNRQIDSRLTPVMAGPYLASRMMSRQIELARDSAGCMYALADAVRHLDAVAICRWRFVVNAIPDLAKTPVAVKLLQQSGRVLDAIGSMNPETEGDLKWERLVLPLP